MQVDLRIKCFDPERDEKPHWEDYRVDVEPTDRVLDALHQVRWYQDGSLAFRRSCAHGVCGSDAMVVNGHNRLACVLLVRDVGPRITVEPLRGLPVLKDLVVDMDAFFAQYRKVLPWLHNDDDPGDTERLQSPEDRARSLGDCRRSVSPGSSSFTSQGMTDRYWAKKASMSTTRSFSTGSPRSGSTVILDPTSRTRRTHASRFSPLMIMASEPHTP